MSGPKIEIYAVEDKRLARAAAAQAKMRDELRSSDERLRQAKKKAREYNLLSLSTPDISSLSDNIIIAKREEIARVMDNTNPVGISDVEVEKRLELIKEEIIQYTKSQEMTAKHKTSLRTFPADIETIRLSNDSAEEKCRRIKELYKDFYGLTRSIAADMELMYAAYIEYLDEYIGIDANPKAITEFTDFSEIESAKIAAKASNREMLEKQYVIEQIGEVMKKHGFNVVQSDNLEKTDGRQLFEMDDDSAVDVYVSDNNQVSMRVVGLGFDSNISEKEDEELFQKQVSFCTQHPQIMRDLERRGVKLSTVVHRPPSKKFNTKIATKSTTGRGNRAKREEKKIGNRTLYKE
jgi:hypothetical protein